MKQLSIVSVYLFLNCLLTASLFAQNFRLTKKPNSPAPSDTKAIIGECVSFQRNDTIYFPEDLRLTISLNEGMAMYEPNVTIMVADTSGGIILSSLIFPINTHPDFSFFFPENSFNIPDSGRMFIVDFNFQALCKFKLSEIVFYIDVDQVPNDPKTWDYIKKFCISDKKYENIPKSIDFRSGSESNSYTIFPNPSRGSFNITFEDDLIFLHQLEIFDQFGRIMENFDYEVNGNVIGINIIEPKQSLLFLKGLVNNLYFSDKVLIHLK